MRRLLSFLLLGLSLIHQSTAFAGERSNTLYLDLDDAVALGIQNNYDLKFKRIEQRVAEKMLKESVRSFLPVVSVDYGNNSRIVPYGQDTRFNSVKLGMEQPIYQGGKNLASWRAAKADIALRNSEQKVLLNNMEMVIRKKYFELVVLNDVCSIQDLLCQHAGAELEIARVEKNVGTMTVLDLAEIEAYAANSELDRIRARNQSDQSRSEFKKLVYIDADTEIDVDRNIAERFECVEPRLDGDSLAASAFMEREEIRTRRLDLQKASAAYKAERYYYLPSISANFEYDLQGERFFPFERSWNVGLKCAVNLGGSGMSGSGNMGKDLASGAASESISSSLSPFSDISVYRRAVQSEAQLSSAKIAVERSQRDIALEVDANIRRVRENWEMLEILRTREDVLGKRFEIYQVKLKLGEARRTDTLKAEVEYAKARVETMKGILEYITASLDLESSVGRPGGSLGTVIRKERK